MSLILPFVQHHVSQFEVSVHNVFLNAGNREEKKMFGHIVSSESLVSKQSVCFWEWHTSMGNE